MAATVAVAEATYLPLPTIPPVPEGESKPQALLPRWGPTHGSNWLLPGSLVIGAYPSPDDAMKLYNAGVRTFVCLQQIINEHGRGEWDSYKAALEATTKAFAATFVHFPMLDHGERPLVEEMTPFVLDLRKRILAGECLYIHCYGGHGRTGTIAIPLISSLCGIDGSQAQRFVQNATNATRAADAHGRWIVTMPETGLQKRRACFTADAVAAEMKQLHQVQAGTAGT